MLLAEMPCPTFCKELMLNVPPLRPIAFSRSTPRLNEFCPSNVTPRARPPFGLPNTSSVLCNPSETPY